MNRPFVAAAVAAGLVAMPAIAQDRATIDRSQIIGNRELPKVLYIVPWKKPAPPDALLRPQSSVVDDALAPIDRDIFRRQLRYDGPTQARASAAASPPSQSTGAP